MSNPKRVLYFAENALSAIQGGGIVACAVLKGLPAENLLGFYEYRNITPVPEYADRFVYLGRWRTPKICQLLNKATNKLTNAFLYRLFTEPYIRKDLAFVEEQVERRGFEPEVVYFAGLSYRYLRLAAKLSDVTGYRHVPANNCCSDLMEFAVKPDRPRPNRIPIITYAGAMNRHLQGETLKVL